MKVKGAGGRGVAGQAGRIHCSPQAAALLEEAGYGVESRGDVQVSTV